MTPEETKAYHREWKRLDRLKNPEKYRERDRVKYLKSQERRKQYARDYRAANPEKVLESNRNSYASSEVQRKNTRDRAVLKKYGITSVQAEALLESQHGVCAICSRPVSLESLPGEIPTGVIDHCHDTHKVRGILCYLCNTGLGAFQDLASVLELAAQYLQETRYGSKGIWPPGKGPSDA